MKICCICSSPKKTIKTAAKKIPILEEQLFVIYFVNKLLAIPWEVCQQYLLNYGNPNDWVFLCAECELSVAEGYRIFKKITKLEVQHKDIQKNIKSRMRKAKAKEEIQEDITTAEPSTRRSTRCQSPRKKHPKPKLVEGATNDIRQHLEGLVADNHDEGDEIVVDETAGSCGEYSDYGNVAGGEDDEDADVIIKTELADYDEDDNTAQLDPLAMMTDDEDVKDVDHYSEDIDNQEGDLANDLDFEVDFSDEPPENLEEDEDEEFSTLLSKLKPKPKNRKSKGGKSGSIQSVTKTSFQGVMKLREELLAKNPPPPIDKDSPDEEKRKRHAILTQYNLKRLCRRHKVSEFPCSFCSEIFSKYDDWNQHFNILKCKLKKPIKKEGDEYICEEGKCEKAFDNVQDLEYHIRNYHSPALGGGQKSANAKMSFHEVIKLREELLAEKLPRIHEDSSYEEKQKRRRIFQQFNLKMLCSRHKVFEYPCSLCSEVFSKYEDWNHHFHILKCKKKPIQYEGCVEDQVSGIVQNLKTHSQNTHYYYLKQRGGQKPAKKMSFEEVIKLRKSLLAETAPLIPKDSSDEAKQKRVRMFGKYNLKMLCMRHKVTEFPCSLCSEVFTKYEDWNRHFNVLKCKFKNPIKVEGAGFICDEDEGKCRSACGSIQSLEDHIRTVHFPKSIACGWCKKIFLKGSAFNVHIYRNPESDCATQQTITKCDQCRNCYFCNQETFDIHMKVKHTNRKPNPFKCSACGLLFGSRGHFNTHLLTTHNEERAYKCDQCDSSFFHANRLKQHIKFKHLSKLPGAPKFPCKICNKNFRDNSHMKRHEKTHNPLNPYLCSICGKGFKLRNYLTIHMWSHDPDRKEKYSSYMPKKRKSKSQKSSSTTKQAEPTLCGETATTDNTPSLSSSDENGSKNQESNLLQ